MFYPPGRNDIAYRIMETDATYIQLTAPADLGWVMLSQAQQISNASAWVTSPDTILLSLEGLARAKARSTSRDCLSFMRQPSVHGGVAIAEFRCKVGPIFDGPENWIWAYEENGTVYSGPMQVPKGQGFEDDTMLDIGESRRVERSTVSGTETPAGPSQPSSSGSTDMGPWMAKIKKLMRIRTVHGSIMSIVFLLLYPTFASFIHLLPSSAPVVKIHASFQAATAALTVTGFGLGIYLTREVPTMGMYHQVIGAIVIVLLVIVQPIIGILQHRIFRQTQRKTWWAYAHRWLGRCMLALGVINGGLGRHLSGSTSSDGSRSAVIAYGVVAGVICSLYMAIIAFVTFKRRPATGANKTESTEAPGNANVQDYPLTEVPTANTVSK